MESNQLNITRGNHTYTIDYSFNEKAGYELQICADTVAIKATIRYHSTTGDWSIYSHPLPHPFYLKSIDDAFEAAITHLDRQLEKRDAAINQRIEADASFVKLMENLAQCK